MSMFALWLQCVTQCMLLSVVWELWFEIPVMLRNQQKQCEPLHENQQSGFPTKSHKNQAVQPHKIHVATSLKFQF